MMREMKIREDHSCWPTRDYALHQTNLGKKIFFDVFLIIILKFLIPSNGGIV